MLNCWYVCRQASDLNSKSAVCAGRPVVTVNGQALVAWTFDYNNVLAWADEAGYSAWLQCLVLPGGPVFVGKITNGDAYEGAPCFSFPA